jgi:ribose/xylose/arabinose/galactoside ABC-type transport system permease subunit
MPLALLALVWIVFGARDSSFLTSGNVYAVLTSFSLYGLVAVGEGVTMIMGEGDLSVGSVAALGGTMAIRLADLGIVPAVIITTLALTGFGALQGFVIHRLRINSLVLTIGSLIGVSGASYLVSDNTTIALPANQIGAGNVLTERILVVFSPFSLVALGFIAITWFVLTYTRPGREIYALGGGRREALAAGVAVRSRFIGAFACSAGAAALGGALLSISAAGATPDGTVNLLLSVFTAVLVGGVAITGGVGSVIGICVGALAIQSIASGVAIEGAASDVSDLMTAGLLVCVLTFDAWFQWLPQRRARLASPSADDGSL